MAEVVVVGAGLGGLAAAARLAKLGHRVTVCERRDVAGGAIHEVRHEGFSWDAGPASTTLPAVLRDLFRKSGRPIERYVDLVARDVVRRHVFADGTSVDLPAGSRARQTAAVDTGLGAGLGERWTAHVDAQAAVWDELRARVLDLPDGGAAYSERAVASSLRARTSLAKLLRRSFKDERLRLLASYPFTVGGSDPRDVPAYAAVESYVERSFGVWEVSDGFFRVVDALVTRLGERGVVLRLGTEVTSIETDESSSATVTGVRTAAGEGLSADVVVTDVDPRIVFGRLLLDPAATGDAHRIFGTAMPTIPPAMTHVGIAAAPGVPSDLPSEVVLHGDPLLVLTTTGRAPLGHHAWTIQTRGAPGEDVLVALARRGIDVRAHEVCRVERDAVAQLGETGGSAYGLAWAGHRSHARRAALVHPLPGVYLVGAGVHPGPSVPYVGWGAAHVAERLGTA